MTFQCKTCGREFEGDACPSCGEEAAINPREIKSQFPESEAIEPRKEEQRGAIKNQTKNNFECSLRMVENITGKKTRVMLFVASSLLLLCGGAIGWIEYATSNGGTADYFLSVLFLALGALLLLFVASFKLIIKKILKKNMQGKESTNEYIFTEKGYEATGELNDGTKSAVSGDYAGFTEVKEYKDMWLLYLNKATIFPVCKEGMKEGAAEDLSALLSRAVGSRYKVCYKVRYKR